MIDYTAKQTLLSMWSWLSTESGPAPITSKALYEVLLYPFSMWSWTSTESGAADITAADDYLIRARRRGRR